MGDKADWPQYSANPLVMEMEIPGSQDSTGGLVAADLNNDGLMDYLVTVSGHVAAYAHDGAKLWINKTDIQVGGSSERHGLPGNYGPGVQAGDIDGDGNVEVLYLTREGRLQVVAGITGKHKWKAQLPVPKGAERWEHLVLANFRGKGDRDLLLQATNAEGYRTGRYVAAYCLDDLGKGKYKPLWQRDDFMACAHNGARLADLDGDGKDEVLGASIVGAAGKILFRIPLKGHIDSIFIADVRPDIKGLEVVALEEGGGNRIFLYNHQRLIWETHYKHQEPQNAAIGEFDIKRPGLEIWCRSRYEEHQKPFVFDARGKLINHYKMDHVAPKGWTVRGVECIFTIDWTGNPRQFAVAKERHESGDVAIFNPVGGKFIKRIKQKADRLYVADVAGDWREEIIVLKGNQLFIYHNPAPNPRPKHKRLWHSQHYRRSKMTWNYYSP
ncbi:MAG: rhamnogalacturonan lyase family protein [Planctomycetota bacterium]